MCPAIEYENICIESCAGATIVMFLVARTVCLCELNNIC